MSAALHGYGPCPLCGRDPAAGFAQIGDDWYCHGDDDPDPTCYMRAQWLMMPDEQREQFAEVIPGFALLRDDEGETE